MGKSIIIKHQDRSGNQIFQYLFARTLQSLVPGSRVSNYAVPMLGLVDPESSKPVSGRSLEIDAGHDVNLTRLAYLMNSDIVDALTLRLYGMRMEYLPDPHVARKLLGLEDAMELSCGDDSLLIPVRAEDLFTGRHTDYVPLPISYYRKIIDQHGLKPVFMGQLGSSLYCDGLRSAFPHAEFRAPASPLDDFRTMMAAPNIAIAVSSFAWLAAWLSPNAIKILLPVYGLFNPAQRPDVDLLPHDDLRYQFYEMPEMKWSATSAQIRRLLTEEVVAHQLTADAVIDLKLSSTFAGGLLSGVERAKAPLKRRRRIYRCVRRVLRSARDKGAAV